MIHASKLDICNQITGKLHVNIANMVASASDLTNIISFVLNLSTVHQLQTTIIDYFLNVLWTLDKDIIIKIKINQTHFLFVFNASLKELEIADP